MKLTRISCNNKFIFLTKPDINKINQFLLFFFTERYGDGGGVSNAVVSVDRQEFIIAHGGNEGVRDFARFAKRIKVDTKVAFRRCIHGTNKWEAIAVIIKGWDVL